MAAMAIARAAVTTRPRKANLYRANHMAYFFYSFFFRKREAFSGKEARYVPDQR
jgi:hypothetical protein